MNPDPEALVIFWGNTTALLEEPFATDVPRDSTGRFFTVERTGGAVERFRDLPMVAVQAWAERRSEASLMIQRFKVAAWTELQYHPGVSRLDINTISHFPGPNGEPRYQAVLELVTA